MKNLHAPVSGETKLHGAGLLIVSQCAKNVATYRQKIHGMSIAARARETKLEHLPKIVRRHTPAVA